MVHYKTEHLEVAFDEYLGCTKMTFWGKAPFEEFVEGHKKMLELYEQKGEGRHYIDTRKMGMLTTEQEDYIAHEYIPKLVALSPTGKIELAMLQSEDVFAKFATMKIDKKANNKIPHHFFKDELQAEQFLQKVAAGQALAS